MKTLRDAVGRILGYQDAKDNKIYLYDITRRELGYYDIRKNETWQTMPRKIIAKEGDLLALLLREKF